MLFCAVTDQCVKGRAKKLKAGGLRLAEDVKNLVPVLLDHGFVTKGGDKLLVFSNGLHFSGKCL